jgi:lambda family phage portal protein
MIARSRRSADNNALSNNIDEVLISHIVGEGIKPEPVVSNVNGTPVEGINKALSEGWKRTNDGLDSTGKQTYYGLQELGLRTIINSGSVLTNMIKSGKGNFLPVQMELVEPDRLDFSRDWRVPSMSDNAPESSTQFGMVLNERGVPQKYWIQGIKNPISADFMDIRYQRRRPQQYIGVPWKARVLKTLFDMDNLIEDKTISSRIQTMIALWMNKNDASSISKGLNSDYNLKWEAGRIMYSGTKPEVISSGENINETFDPMTRLLSRFVAIGNGFSYQTLTRDLQGMNFASSRANILEDRKFFRRVQRWFVKEYCQLDWEKFVFWMFATGKIPGKTLADFNADPWKYTQCHWQTPGWEWVDPMKDAQAAVLMLQNHMTTLKDVYGKLGKNWEAEVKQGLMERKMIQDLKAEMGIVDLVGPSAAVGSFADEKDPDDNSNGNNSQSNFNGMARW